MPRRAIQSKQNARLNELRRALTRPGRDTHGLAGIEGVNLLEGALRGELHVPCVFVAEDAEVLLKGLRLPADTEILVMPRALLDSVLQTETPQPVAALVETPDWTLSHVLGPGKWSAPLILVLAGLQDPGNLGTILRSAPEECFSSLRKAGIRILTTTVHAAEPLDFCELTGPTAFLIGNEGSGVPENLAAFADEAITIPCPGAVESLNAAVAVSVLLYESSRQRLASSGGPAQHRRSQR